MGVLEAAGAFALVVPFALGLAAAPDPDGEVVTHFADPEIVESSGLVLQDGLFHTMNDSGDSGRVFSVDPDSGETVGVTSWEDEPDDLEAVAPAGDGHVWVADIGDNRASRDSIEVALVPVGRGERRVDGETIDLVYPGGPRDAETLLVHPVSGRLYVVSKQVFGGDVFAAPRRLAADGPNSLRALGQVIGIATDGAFFPDGRHLILRSYGSAVVYTFPGLEAVDRIDLPAQEQGEGIAVGPDSTVYLSSEGLRAPILRVPLPPAVRRVVAEPGPSAGSPSSSPSPSPSSDTVGPAERDVWSWVLGGLIGIVVVGVLVRSLRPR